MSIYGADGFNYGSPYYDPELQAILEASLKENEPKTTEDDEDEAMQRALAESTMPTEIVDDPLEALAASFPKQPSTQPAPTPAPFPAPVVQAEEDVEYDEDYLKALALSYNNTQPSTQPAPTPTPLPTPVVQVEEDIEYDEDYLKALALSFNNTQPSTQPAPTPTPLPAPVVQVEGDGEYDEDYLKALAASMEPVRIPTKPEDQVIHDIRELSLKEELERREKQEQEELEAARRLSIKGTQYRNPFQAPLPTPAAPRADLNITRKPRTVVEETLVKTTLASSSQSSPTLEAAVENAKKNTKLWISAHEIKQNEVHNVYLVLTFPSELKRNLAVEELRTKHKMFQKGGEPKRVGTNQLEFTVEQTIDFQQKF